MKKKKKISELDKWLKDFPIETCWFFTFSDETILMIKQAIRNFYSKK